MMMRKLIIVGGVALFFRLIFLFWGWLDIYLLEQNVLSKVYFLQGYGICAGYGYVREQLRDQSWKDLDNLYKMVQEGQRITPQTAPRPETSALMPEMLHPPGMALLIAAIHWITGARADLYVEILGMLMDTAAACILYWLLWKFFSQRVAFAAGLIYALYPPLAYASTLDRSPEGLLSVFIVSSLACVLQSTSGTNWKCALWWIVAGLLIGISAYFRSDYLLVPVAFGFALWLYTLRFWRSALALIIMQAVAFAILTPWAYRNHQLCGRWVFTSTSVGWTLYGSLGEFNNPWGIKGLDKYREIEAKAQGFQSPASSEADLYFRRRFSEAVKSNPWAYVTIVVKRLPLAVVAPQTFGFKNPLKSTRISAAREQGQDRFAVILSKPLYVAKAYWDWLLMGVIGFAALLCSLFMIIRERRRFGLIFLLLSAHLYAMGTHVLIYYEPRYVLPSMFSFLIGLAYVLARGWRERDAAIAAS